MPSLNTVILMGNLTRDPELRHTTGGTVVANLGLAVNSRVKRQGEWAEEVCFVDCTVFNTLAENCAKYLTKGSPVLVDGRLQLQQWKAQDGTNRSKHVILANSVQFLSSRTREPGSDDTSDAPVNDDVPF